MNMRTKLLTQVTCLALLLAQVAAAAAVGHAKAASVESPVQVTTNVDRNTAQVAEPVRLTVKVQAPSGVRVSFPAVSDRLGDFDVISSNDKLDIPAPSGRTSTRTYVLECLTPGKHEIPAISISYSDNRYVDGRSPASASKSTQQLVESRPVEIVITSLLEGETDPTKFRDIKGIVAIAPPAADESLLTYSIAAIAVLAGIGLAALFYLKKEQQLSARDWAVAELERLVRERQADQVNAEDFYSQVTDIVREFIERRFYIAAPRLTTAEFFDRVKRNAQLASYLKPLRSFLTTADMVKFAGVRPQASDCEAAIEKAHQFIEASVAHSPDSPPNDSVVDNSAPTSNASSTAAMKETV